MLLLLSFSAFVAIVDAHDPHWEITTYIYVSTTPNPVGVGQQVTAVVWLNYAPQTATGSVGDRWYFYLDIEKPDNSTETVGPLVSDAAGGTFYTFTPKAAGPYTLTARFGPQVLTGKNGTDIMNSPNNAFINDTFKASSAKSTFIVQEETVPDVSHNPLPTEYWTRPIDGQNTSWFTIGSNWLGYQQTARYQDGIAPNSAHVMWTKPLTDGGLVGGNNTGIEATTFYDGTSYEGRFGNPIVISGRLYYAVPKSNSASGGGYAAVDLRTGESIFWQNMTMPTFGQVYSYESMNQHGVIPNGYLWRTSGSATTGYTWNAYDSINGDWLFTLTGAPVAPSSTSWGTSTVYGSNGEILYYNLNSANNWLALWNNTAAQGLTGATTTTDTYSTNYFQWRPVGKTVNTSQAYSWNVTLSKALPGPRPSIVASFEDDIILGTSTTFQSLNAFGTPDPWTMWAISLKPEDQGRVIWTQNYVAPANNMTVYLGPVDTLTRTFTVLHRDGLTISGYDLDTGKLKWTSEQEDAWGYYHTGFAIDNGVLFHSGYGTLYAYNLTNGNTLWNFTAPGGLAIPYPYYPLGINAVADGKVFLGTVEHSRNTPYYTGSKTYAINATTGEEIWSLVASTPSAALGLGQATNGFAIADGFYTYLNLYDGQIYTIGKGPSKTTVTASPKVLTIDGSILIEGNVYDIATGVTQAEQKARFPDGVPAVSDESQSLWMEYIYMNRPRPKDEDVTGVSVTLSVLDGNNNYNVIGTTTADSDGHFSFKWAPEIAGVHTVTARFGGSESYWPSHAETSFAVDDVVITPAPTETPESISDIYFLPAIGGLFALIIVVAIILMLMIRKRP